MAGLRETWSSNGEVVKSVPIITADANDVVGKLHDRMPVVLEGDEERRRLDANAEDERLELLESYPDDRTRSYEVGRSVNNPASDPPWLVEPVGSDHSGLGDFA